MGKTLAAFQTEVKDELGTDLTGLYSDIDTLIERWVNRGQQRLDWQIRRITTLSWAAGATTIPLPADFARWGRYLQGTNGIALPSGHEAEGVYHVHSPSGAMNAGSGRLLYWAYPRTITAAVSSELPTIGDTALISFAFYSFWNRIATSRSDYEKYSVLIGQNGVDLEELRQLARDHYDDFVAAANSLPRFPSVSYYGD